MCPRGLESHAFGGLMVDKPTQDVFPDKPKEDTRPKIEPELLTISQFCQLGNVGPTVAYEELAAGRLKGKKIRSKTVIERAEARRWIAELPPYKRKDQKDEGGPNAESSA